VPCREFSLRQNSLGERMRSRISAENWKWHSQKLLLNYNIWNHKSRKTQCSDLILVQQIKPPSNSSHSWSSSSFFCMYTFFRAVDCQTESCCIWCDQSRVCPVTCRSTKIRSSSICSKYNHVYVQEQSPSVFMQWFCLFHCDDGILS